MSSAMEKSSLDGTPQRRRRGRRSTASSPFISSKLVLEDELSVCISGCKYSLHEVQCKLNDHGLTELIINLIMMNSSENEVHTFPYEVFIQALKLAVAILNEGNEVVQVSLLAHTHIHIHTLTESNLYINIDYISRSNLYRPFN